MIKKIIYPIVGIAFILIAITGCKTPTLARKEANTETPESYNGSKDTINVANIQWKDYFKDENLNQLIEMALKNNQELNIILQEIEISKNEIRARKGEYLPFVGVVAGAGVDKVGRYTRNGALEANNDIKPGVEFPEPLSDYALGVNASWEIDVWKKLRNAKKSAVKKYLATIEGRNFMVTHLIAEISNSYYELLALDNQLAILKENIEIQSNAYEIVKAQKQAARVTQLAVRRFEAQVLNTKSRQYSIQQKIIQTENRINFLVGRYPKKIVRDASKFKDIALAEIQSGIPSQLLENRPDFKRASLLLASSKLDVKVAKAKFYPSLRITASVGYNAFDPEFLFSSPKSLIYSLAGDLMAPLINRNAIKASYYNANAKQVQAIFNYEKTILNGYIEVVNRLSNINNLKKTYELKEKEVEALTQSITISNSLFKSARADYMEVLLTQREALESRFELIETKKEQMNAMVNIYQALGGGWQ